MRRNRPGRPAGPPIYPAPEQSFAGYPTAWLTDADRVQSQPGWPDRVSLFLNLPLTNLAGNRRSVDPVVLDNVLRLGEQSATVNDLANVMERTGISATAARATIAWLLKYGLFTRTERG